VAGFLDRFTNTKHTTISLPCIFTIRARAHNLDTLSHQSGTIRNKRKMIYLTECVSHNIVPFPLTLTTITPSYYLRPRIFRARLLPCTLGKRRLRSIRLLIFPNRTRSRSGCHLTWLSGGTGPFRTIRRLESEAAQRSHLCVRPFGYELGSCLAIQHFGAHGGPVPSSPSPHIRLSQYRSRLRCTTKERDQANLKTWTALAPRSRAAGDCSSFRMLIRDIRLADSWKDFGFADYPGGWNRTKDRTSLGNSSRLALHQNVRATVLL
jgi:hypothetical protein